jgi:hypothetical protein
VFNGILISSSPFPEDLLEPGIEPRTFLQLQDLLTTERLIKPLSNIYGTMTSA